MDTQGNLFNFYNDVGGERKITPVGNIADLTSFKVGTRIPDERLEQTFYSLSTSNNLIW